MNTLPAVWPVTDLVIFDCDSTLAAIEGIDELARLTGKQDDIAVLTKRAMEGDIPLESVYGQRLDISKPTLTQVEQVAQLYADNVIAHSREVISALQTAGCKVFIVSGGLYEPVRRFGEWLGVPREHIHAVKMQFDQLAGEWWRYWEQPGGKNPNANYMSIGTSPLAGTNGKNLVIDQIRSAHPGRAMLIGDGMSDFEAHPHVDLFIGFGGVVTRERVQRESPIYLTAPSLAAILPLALGQRGNTAASKMTFDAGLTEINTGTVQFQNPDLKALFDATVIS